MRTWLAAWRPALRVARRDARRHPLATLLAGLLVALPVVVAVAAACLNSSMAWDGENSTYARMGAADADLDVTGHTAVSVRYLDHGTWARARGVDGKQTPRRDPGEVDVVALLPEGSRIVPAPGHRALQLASGGSVQALVLDLSDPISTGLAELDGGRAPAGSDEVAVEPAMADAFGLIDDDGRLRDDAVLETRNGSDLSVVGLVDDGDSWGTSVVVPPTTSTLDTSGTTRWLADLPELTTGQLRDLRDRLADVGVVALFRDAAQHPEHWPELRDAAGSDQVDPEALALGALVVGFGLLEVVLLVGAALAVGARRQVRTLGLLASTGGAPRDIRRVVLARGLLIGGGASLVAVVAGVWGTRLALPLVEAGIVAVNPASLSPPLIVLDVVWTNVVAIGLLGALSGLLAAAYPAWAVGRMPPVDALAGRFPAGRRPVRLRAPAVWLAGTGLVGLVASGFWISAEFAEQTGRRAGPPSVLPVAFGGLCLLLLVAGLVWLTPYVVQRAGAGSSRLGLAGRLAVRDATRHRQRTAAAVVGLTVTVAGAVFAGFGVSAVAATDDSQESWSPPGSGSIYAELGRDREAALARLRETVETAIGAETVLDLRDAQVSVGGRGRDVHLAEGGDVTVVDEDFVEVAGWGPETKAAYAAGAVLVDDPEAVHNGMTEIEATRRDAQPWTRDVRAVVVDASWRSWSSVGQAWMSPETAAALGAELGGTTLLAYEPGGFDAGDDDLLRLYGIESDWVGDSLPSSALLAWAMVGGALLVTALAVGVVVALAAAEGRDDAATMAAVGAPPGRRRVMGAVHGAFVGALGGGLGALVGSAAGASLLQMADTPGVPVPWLGLAVVVVALPVMAAAVGWAVTPSRVSLVRRTA